MKKSIKILLTMIVCGIICGFMMWLAFGFISSDFNPENLSGAIVGGMVVGYIMYLLS